MAEDKSPAPSTASAPSEASRVSSSPAISELSPISTTSELCTVVVKALDEPMKMRQKVAPDGRTTFSTGAMLRVASKASGHRLDRGSWIHVIDGSVGETLEDGALYRGDGQIWITPMGGDGGPSSFSIICERLVKIASRGES